MPAKSYELKPCPFCGSSRAVMHYIMTQNRFCIRCQDCGVKSRAFLDAEEAVASWNTRISSKTTIKEIKEIARKLTEIPCDDCIAYDICKPKHSSAGQCEENIMMAIVRAAGWSV